MDSVKIFLSFSSSHAAIAKGLKAALLSLETDQVHLDVQFSVDMHGATDWRRWIEEQVRSADVFLLVYPHRTMPMDWSNYELGRFIDRGLPVVCLKNTDIDTPPPAFQPFQAYNADFDGILRFLHELFANGTLTGGRVLNAQIARTTSDHGRRAREVAEDLAALFAQARKREHFYERRVVVSTAFDAEGRLDAQRTTLHGNAEGLQVLGLNATRATPWHTLRKVMGDESAWLQEIEAAIPTVPSGVLPPALSPFRSAGGTFIPVIVKAEVTDDRLTDLVLIFVAAADERLRPLFGWTFPALMPEGMRGLLLLVRLMFRARWEILAPRHQELRYGRPAPDAAEVAARVLADYDRLQRRAQAEGAAGADQFYGLFRRDLHGELRDCGEEWLALVERLRTPESPQAVTQTLEALLVNNRRWLDLAGRQFQQMVSDLV